MSVLLNCILFAIFIYLSQSSFNSNPIKSILGLNGSKGTTIQIFGDEDMIAAGFNDGTIKIFDIQVNQICSNTSTTGSSIIQILWMPNSGLVTVHEDKNVILWNLECIIQNQISFNQSITRMAYLQQVNATTQEITGYIAFNFQDKIQEYFIKDFTQSQSYLSEVNDSFIDFQYYSSDGENFQIITSTKSSKIKMFNISDGSQLSSFDIQSPIQKMAVLRSQSGDKMIGYAASNNIYHFTSTGNVYNLGWFQPSTSIVLCPSTTQLVLSQINNKNIGVYLYYGNKQKSLTGLNGYPLSIDCSEKYLVSIDDQGYINVYDYETFKTWIIGMIVGMAVGLLALVIGVIAFIRLRMKWVKEADQEKYKIKKPNKYPKNKNTPKTQSMKMLSNITIQTTMMS